MGRFATTQAICCSIYRACARAWLFAAASSLAIGCQPRPSNNSLVLNREAAAPLARVLIAASSSPTQATSEHPSPEVLPPDVAKVRDRAGSRAGEYIRPNPIVSRGRPIFAHSLADGTDPKTLNDGLYRADNGVWRAGTPKANDAPWAAIDIGSGYRKLLLVWADAGTYDYEETTYGSPEDYRIEVSADSTNGQNGSWQTIVSVSKNKFHARGHSFEFTGKRWVKLVLVKAPKNSPNGLVLDEIDIHDLSGGGTDSWVFMGDSITAFCYDRSSEGHQPSFAELVHRAYPRYFPAMINAGIGGENSRDALEHVDEWLAVNPDFKYWALGYGTNDAAGNTDDTEEYRSRMQTVIAKILAAGRVPILARIPFAADGDHAGIPKFNGVVDALRAANTLPGGANLYGWFRQHPEQLRDKLHPDDRGIVEANRLWFEATKPLYQP
jgi:acyl-CoA thioesterase I